MSQSFEYVKGQVLVPFCSMCHLCAVEIHVDSFNILITGLIFPSLSNPASPFFSGWDEMQAPRERSLNLFFEILAAIGC